MLSSVLAVQSSGGGPGSDTTAARLVDPRFRGIQRIDLKASYGARCDGASHPLSGIFGSLAAATAAYPNAGLTGATWATMEIDTAAFLQAEYDIRTSSAGAGVIGLHEGASMMVSQQLNIQDASRVWFHGGRHVTLFAAGCGTIPAIRLANCPNVGLPLADFRILAQPTEVFPSSSGGGVPHTGFATGSTFLQLDNVQGIDIERIGWNGFDNPILWGNHVYGIRFRQCGGSGCNIGLNWSQTVGLDSMERIYFEGGALANNNYGFYFDATYGAGKTASQGGSLFLQDSAIDYNIVRQGVYVGNPMNTANPPVVNSYGGNSLHITRCHIETTGACSGTAKSRIRSQGTLLMSENEIYENDANVPTGYVEVADNTSCSMVNNRVNNTTMALMYSATDAKKRITAHGNIMQDTFARPIMMVDTNGPRMQPASDDGGSMLIFGDPHPMDAKTYYGAMNILCDYFGGASPLTLDDTGYPIGYTFNVWCLASPVTIAVKSGTMLTSFPSNAYRLTTPGTFAVVRRHSLTEWVIIGALVT